VSDILKELEQDFGKPRKEWSLEEWKQAAIGNSTLRASADVLIQLLEEQVAIFKEYTQHLETRIAQLEKRRIGAPRKPKKPISALALLCKRKRGRPTKKYTFEGGLISYTNLDYARDLRHVVDGIKARRNIKTDTEALAIIYKTVPLRKRTPLIEYDAKLLSKHRKLIAKIE
jgi:hypothetical protein